MTRRRKLLPSLLADRRTHLALKGVTAILALLSLLGSILSVDYQLSLVDASRYNRTFNFNQVAVDVLRLQVAIGAVASGGAEAEAEARLRYEILASQATSFSASGEGSDGRTAPAVAALGRRFHDTVETLRPLMARLPAPDAARDALETLAPLTAPLVRAAALSHAEAGDDVASNQQKLSLAFFGVSILTMVLVLFGALLVVMVGRQNSKLQRLATTDALTARPNRLAFTALLRHLENETCAVLLVNIDHFKTVSDTLGHETADQLVLVLSGLIGDLARDAAFLARVDGDQFAALYRDEQADKRASEAAGQIQARLRQPLQLGKHEIHASVTIGLASGPNTEADPLFKKAGIALQVAKAGGRGQILMFQEVIGRAFAHRNQLHEDLQHAIERGELHLAFQPIVDLADRRTRGFEALLRWTHRELGPISPAEFVPIAEETGLIVPIGRWVVESALQQAKTWPEDIFLAVNMSARQLADSGFADYVEERLRHHAIGHRRLEFEITESLLIENDATALALLHRLRALGCRFALDDFGTGYASLSYLRRFPFDKLKIDQFFMRGNSEEDLAIIRTVCELADRLKLDIVAEGIETEQNRIAVRLAGGQMGQGYLFDRPLSAEGSLARLEKEGRLPQRTTGRGSGAAA